MCLFPGEASYLRVKLHNHFTRESFGYKTLLLLKASECSGTLWLLEDGRGRHGPTPWAAEKRNTATLVAAGPVCAASLSMLPPTVSFPSAQRNSFKKREGTLRTHAAAQAHLVASTPQHWE